MAGVITSQLPSYRLRVEISSSNNEKQFKFRGLYFCKKFLSLIYLKTKSKKNGRKLFLNVKSSIYCFFYSNIIFCLILYKLILLTNLNIEIKKRIHYLFHFEGFFKNHNYFLLMLFKVSFSIDLRLIFSMIVCQ